MENSRLRMHKTRRGVQQCQIVVLETGIVAGDSNKTLTMSVLYSHDG